MSTTTTTTMTTNDKSKTIDHVNSYPALREGFEHYKSYPLGRKSLDLTQAGYDKFVTPLLPYAAGPYAHIAPLVTKADDLTDRGLTKVDTTFPLLTKDAATIKSTILAYATFPFRFLGSRRDYVYNVYAGEYRKCGGEGQPYAAPPKAVLTTSIVVASDALAWVAELVSQTRAQGGEMASETYSKGAGYARSQYEYVNGKKDQYVSYASEKVEQARNLAYAKKEEVERKAGEVKRGGQQKGK